MLHLAIDCGRNAVKVVGPNGYSDWFPSYVGEARSTKLENELRTTDAIVETSFGTYFIGDIAKDESYDGGRLLMASKVHQDTLLLILVAVLRAAQNGTTVTVTTGLPIEFHTANYKKDFAEMLEGAYTTTLNGVKKSVVIRDVRVAAEGASSYAYLCGGQGGTRRFLDLGSRTVNYGTVINGRYNDKESGTLDYGCDTVPAGGDALARKIGRDMSLRWRTLDDRVFVLGGGAKVCSFGLFSFFPSLVCAADPYFANANAFFKLGEKALCRTNG